jgi:formylglycine-generating enzyme
MQRPSLSLSRGLAALALLGATPIAAAACAGAPVAPAAAPPTPAAPAPIAPIAPIASAEQAAQADAGPADDNSEADAAAAADAGFAVAAADAGASAAGASACPAGMVLVDGDYCTDVEVKCLRSTYAKQNKKTICHEFQPPAVCVGKKEHKRFCIDTYEYPNKKGERPEVMNDFPHAQRLCAGQGKRVCTETEWTTACEGPTYKPYPYGYVRDPNKCRGDREYRFPNVKKTVSKDKKAAQAEVLRLWDGVASGSQPDCVSDYGVHDMPGNTDELASSETPQPRSKFDNVTTGGPWLEGVRNQCRPKIYTHNEGFAYYYLSFRCCAEPDGKPTDPRSPKQRDRGERWKP